MPPQNMKDTLTEPQSHRATETTEEDFSVLFVRSVRDLILMLAAWRFIEVLRLSR